MDKLRIGVIGCGGRANAHISGLIKMDDVEIVALADPIEERLKYDAELTGAKRLYDGFNSLYKSESKDTLDALVIAIEPTAHENCELQAIDKGLPFLVEKPMTLDLELADKIAKLTTDMGLVTCVGFQDRYLDLVNMIKDELPKHRKGLTGIASWLGGVPSPWWWQKKSTCGGQLVEQNIHLLDGLRYLFGEPLSVYATCEQGILKPGVDVSEIYDTDDHSTAVYRFKDHVTVTVLTGDYFKSVDPNCGMYLPCDDIIFDYRLRNNLTIYKHGEMRDVKRGNDQTFDLDRAFVDAVRNNDPAGVKSSYADAVKTLKMGFAANKSMETGEVVYFD